jgi:hypothetical protein
MFGKIFSFFGDILKQVLIKFITFALIILLIIFCIKHFLNVDILKLFGL